MKYRKSNRAKQVSHGCGNNGTCKVCEGDRLHGTRRDTQDKPAQMADEDKCRELGVCRYCEGTLELFAYKDGSFDTKTPCVCVRGKK